MDCYDSICVEGRFFTQAEIELHSSVRLVTKAGTHGTLWGPEGTAFENTALVKINCKQHVNIEALLSWYGVKLAIDSERVKRRIVH